MAETHGNGSGKQTASLVNSVLLLTLLGVSGFIGNATWSNSNKLEAIAASQISRSEFESKLTELKTEQSRMHIKLIELEISIAKISSRPSLMKP